MSWLYSQALVEEYLGENFSDGEQSAPSNGKHIPQAYLPPDKMMEFSRLSRFGMTFKPLTDAHGEALLMSYREVFHAKTSQSQAEEQESKENEVQCGEKWRGSFTKYDPDTSSWKTHQCSLLGGLDEFLETWPQWGLMRNGECWERQTLVQTTKETESGFWPTPTSHNAKETNAPSEALRNEPSLASRVGGKLNPRWVEWLMGWPLGWTGLKPLEMDKSHYAPQPLGKS